MKPSACQATFACVTAAWRAHEGELHGYLRHRLADAAAAEDVLQDVFLKAMRAGQGFCTLEDPGPGCFRWRATPWWTAYVARAKPNLLKPTNRTWPHLRAKFARLSTHSRIACFVS